MHITLLAQCTFVYTQCVTLANSVYKLLVFTKVRNASLEPITFQILIYVILLIELK